MATVIGTGLESYIKRNARERALNHIAEAQSEAQAILDQSAKRAQLIREETHTNTLKTIAENQRRLAAQAQLKAQQLRLGRREAMIDRVWHSARECLEEMGSPAQRREMLHHLLADAAAQLGGGPIEVQVNEKDRALLGGAMLQDITSDLQRTYGISEITVAPQPAYILGGVIVRRLDIPEMVDNSLDYRLALAKQGLRDGVYRLLTEGELQPPDERDEADDGARTRGAE